MTTTVDLRERGLESFWAKTPSRVEVLQDEVFWVGLVDGFLGCGNRKCGGVKYPRCCGIERDFNKYLHKWVDELVLRWRYSLSK